MNGRLVFRFLVGVLGFFWNADECGLTQMNADVFVSSWLGVLDLFLNADEPQMNADGR